MVARWAYIYRAVHVVPRATHFFTTLYKEMSTISEQNTGQWGVFHKQLQTIVEAMQTCEVLFDREASQWSPALVTPVSRFLQVQSMLMIGLLELKCGGTWIAHH